MRKQYSASFKTQVVQEMMREQYTVGQIAAQHGVHPMQLSKWKSTVMKGMPSLFGTQEQEVVAMKAAHEQQTAELYAEIGRLTTQLTWLKKKSGIQIE